MRLNSLTLLAAMGLAVSVSAQAADDRYYLVPSIGYISPDGDRKADDSWGLGLGLGRQLNEDWNLELGARYSDMDRNAGGSYDQRSIGLDALRFFKRDADFAPYAVVGLGYLRTKIPGDTDNSLMANAGLGFLKQLSDNVSLRADARYRWNDNNLAGTNGGSFGDWLVNFGLQIALGQKAATPAAAPAPTPAPAAAPAPAPAPAPAAAEPAKGNHALDKAKSGDVIVILHGVNFEFDSAKLRPDAVSILNDAVDALKRRTDINVGIVGHTCNIGTEAYNQGLSERRAKSVYDYFTNNGIDGKRLTSKGEGESHPAFSNATREGRAKNRRVELHVK